jgi:hypothetical protein
LAKVMENSSELNRKEQLLNKTALGFASTSWDLAAKGLNP